MPNTSDRVIDSAVYAVLAESLKHSLHPAQALINGFKEPQANYAAMQHYLELKKESYAVMLTDFAKAFERINPWWVLECLAARAAPAWVKAYVIHLMFGRRTQHKIQGHFLPPLMINQGLAMGRATSVVLFCLALDPLICALQNVSAFIRLTAYMDDGSAAAKGIRSINQAQRTFAPAHSAGLQVLQHNCFQIGVCDLRNLSVEVRKAFRTYGAALLSPSMIPPCSTLRLGFPSLSLALASSNAKSNHTHWTTG